MSKTKLLDNAFIIGYKTLLGLTIGEDVVMDKHETIYSGKTSIIPREIAKKYFDYGYDDLEIIYTSLDESIKSACKDEYCVIYKKL